MNAEIINIQTYRVILIMFLYYVFASEALSSVGQTVGKQTP
jgi:hypothetical protein